MESTASQLKSTQSEQPCAACGTVHGYAYCPACGQKRWQRFDLKWLLKTIADLFDIETGIPNTLWQTLVRPDVVVSKYWSGDTTTHINPFRLMVICLAVSAIISATVLDRAFSDFGHAVHTPDMPAWFNVFGKDFMYLIKEYDLVKYSNFAALPFQGLALYLFFYKRKVSYAEHLIANAYIFSASSLYVVPHALVIVLVDHFKSPEVTLLQGLLGLLTPAYILYAYGRVYGKRGNRLGPILKAMLAQMIGSLMLLLLFMLGYITYRGIWKEVLQLF